MSVLPDLAQQTRERIELMVSELTTNAVKHSQSRFNVTVVVAGERSPVPRHPAPTDPGGRGLMIVQALSDEWGVEQHDGDKTVWFTLSDRPR